MERSSTGLTQEEKPHSRPALASISGDDSEAFSIDDLRLETVGEGGQEPGREAIDPAKLAEANKMLDELYKEKFKTASSMKGLDKLVELTRLADEVLALRSNEEEPAARYAVFEMAIDMLKQSCHPAETFTVVQDFANEFDVDDKVISLDLFKYWARNFSKLIGDADLKRQTFVASAEHAESFRKGCLQDKRFELALEFAETAREFYIRGSNRDAANRVSKELPRLKSLARKERRARDILEALKEDLDQPEKLLEVGCYYYFTLEDLEKGAAVLKKVDPALANCIDNDSSVTSDTREAVGDLWWELAERKDLKLYRSEIYAKAAEHYFKAILDTKGIAQKRLIARVREVYPTPRIKIIDAKFGWPKTEKVVDVTDFFRELIKNEKPVFVSNSKGLNVRDPVVGWKKRIEISYLIGGVKKKVSVSEGNNEVNLRDLIMNQEKKAEQ